MQTSNSTKKPINISLKKYTNLYTMQPYFIWKDLDALKNDPSLIPEKDIYGFKLYDKNSIKKISYDVDDLDSDEDDDEESEEWLFKKFATISEKFLYADEDGAHVTSDIDQNAYMFSKARDQLIDYIKNTIALEEYKYSLKEIGVTKFIQSANDAEAQSQEQIKDSSIKFLINPSISYTYPENDKGDIFKVNAKVWAYDKTTKTMYLAKLNSKTKAEDYLVASFNHGVFQKAGVEVKKIIFIILDPSAKAKKNILNFTQAIASWTNKGGFDFDRTNKDKLEVQYYANKGFYFYDKDKDYLATVKRGELPVGPRIISKKDSNGFTFSNIKNDFISENDKNYHSSLIPFDLAIKKITDAYYYEIPTYSDNGKGLNIYDDTYGYFGRNPLALPLVNLYIGLENEFSCGQQLAVKKVDEDYIKIRRDFIHKRKITHNYFSDFALEILSQLHRKDQRVIWYDYEGLTSVLPVLDNVQPYRQIVHQVSIIETRNGKIIDSSVNNIVKDPATITLLDIVDNIISVYSNSADVYVVFNKGYENSRNKETVELLKIAVYDDKNEEVINGLKQRNLSVARFSEIVEWINSHTLDLYDCFKPTKEDKRISNKTTKDLPFETKIINDICDKPNTGDLNYLVANKANNYLANFDSSSQNNAFDSTGNMPIYIKQLKGRGSIKKVEHVITEYNIDIPNKIIPYPQLEQIHQGGEALDAATKRYLGITKDNEWAKTVKNLKRYCENDVRAMIMAYEFINKMVTDVFPEVKQLAFTLAGNEYYAFDPFNKKVVVKKQVEQII